MMKVCGDGGSRARHLVPTEELSNQRELRPLSGGSHDADPTAHLSVEDGDQEREVTPYCGLIYAHPVCLGLLTLAAVKLSRGT